MPVDKLNIIIPLFNPHEGWDIHFTESLTNLREKLPDTDLMVILVNDGSTMEISNIDEMLARFNFLKYFSYPANMGKGHAVRYGACIEDADYYFYTDADFPFGDTVIVQAYREMKSSKISLIIGIRDSNYFKGLPFKRKILTLVLRGFNYVVTGFKLYDTQAPLKGMDNKARQILTDGKINGFIFDFEFVINCLKHRIPYSTISLTLRKGIAFTNFRFKTLVKELINLLKVIF